MKWEVWAIKEGTAGIVSADNPKFPPGTSNLLSPQVLVDFSGFTIALLQNLEFRGGLIDPGGRSPPLLRRVGGALLALGWITSAFQALCSEIPGLIKR